MGKNYRDGATVCWKLQDPNFNRFCMNHPCDGQTDRQTDGIAIAYARLQHTLSRAKTTCVHLSVCLSVRAPTVAMFVRCWYFAQELGARKVRTHSLDDQNPITFFVPVTRSAHFRTSRSCKLNDIGLQSLVFGSKLNSFSNLQFISRFVANKHLILLREGFDKVICLDYCN